MALLSDKVLALLVHSAGDVFFHARPGFFPGAAGCLDVETLSADLWESGTGVAAMLCPDSVVTRLSSQKSESVANGHDSLAELGSVESERSVGQDDVFCMVWKSLGVMLGLRP